MSILVFKVMILETIFFYWFRLFMISIILETFSLTLLIIFGGLSYRYVSVKHSHTWVCYNYLQLRHTKLIVLKLSMICIIDFNYIIIIIS